MTLASLPMVAPARFGSRHRVEDWVSESLQEARVARLASTSKEFDAEDAGSTRCNTPRSSSCRSSSISADSRSSSLGLASAGSLGFRQPARRRRSAANEVRVADVAELGDVIAFEFGALASRPSRSKQSHAVTKKWLPHSSAAQALLEQRASLESQHGTRSRNSDWNGDVHKSMQSIKRVQKLAPIHRSSSMSSGAH